MPESVGLTRRESGSGRRRGVSEENKALAHRVFEEVFNGGNLQAMDELYAPDYVHHDPSLPPEM
jgi:hypothetical protein